MDIGQSGTNGRHAQNLVRLEVGHGLEPVQTQHRHMAAQTAVVTKPSQRPATRTVVLVMNKVLLKLTRTTFHIFSVFIV